MFTELLKQFKYEKCTSEINDMEVRKLIRHLSKDR